MLSRDASGKAYLQAGGQKAASPAMKTRQKIKVPGPLPQDFAGAYIMFALEDCVG